MTKIKTYVTAVFTANVLALILFIPAMSGGLYANGQEIYGVYDKLYYFSDSPKAYERFTGYFQSSLSEYDSQFLYQNIDHYTESEFIDLSSYDEESLKQFLDIGFSDYDDMGNSFIIFELSKIRVTEEIALLLNDLFSHNKENYDCKIMFISNTDERLYSSESELLDYVDIHFNTDLFYDMMLNILYCAGDTDGTDFRDLTFIFDESLSSGVADGNPKDNEIISCYLLKILKFFNKDDLNNHNPACVSEIFARYNVNLFFYLGDGIYYDPVFDTEYDSFNHYQCEELKERLFNTDVQVVGTTKNGTLVLQDFIHDTKSFLSFLYLDEANYYFYVPDDIFPFFDGDFYFLVGYDSNFHESRLSSIVSDFIRGYDLTIYDNWTGRCVVTHKLINLVDPSPNGWLRDLSDWWQDLDSNNLNFDFDSLPW